MTRKRTVSSSRAMSGLDEHRGKCKREGREKSYSCQNHVSLARPSLYPTILSPVHVCVALSKFFLGEKDSIE